MRDYVHLDIPHTLKPTTCDIYENAGDISAVAWRFPDNTGVRIRDEVADPVIYEGTISEALGEAFDPENKWRSSFGGGSTYVNPRGQVWMDDDDTLYLRLFPDHANTGQFVRKLSE
jgi:hypothetical protein